MEKSNEIKAIESQWQTLDDASIIRDVLFKGKFISNAIKFISDRNKIENEETLKIFFDVVRNMVKILVQNKQLHRANHILKNAQLNEIHYLYDIMRELNDERVNSTVMEFIRKSSATTDDEEKLKSYHTCFRLLIKNIRNHGKYLESINKSNNNFSITSTNSQNSNIIFGTFMKQPLKWKNEISVDVFFKSKRDSDVLNLLPILEKESFFIYIIQNELYGLLKRWLHEQYLCRAGKAIASTLHSPQSFDDGVNFLFRQWHFEQFMMERISRREKDVIKNDFAKLALFEGREAKCLSRKLNRLFTTHTFHENYHLAIGSDEITKFIIENKLVDLFCEKFIDHAYIRELTLNEYSLKDELLLVASMKDLLSKETALEDFVRIMNETSDYVKKFDQNFNINRSDLSLINGSAKSFEKFHEFAENNAFMRNLFKKLTTNDDLPTLEYLLLYYHSININFIRDDFSSPSLDYIPSFEDENLSNSFGEKASLNYLNYIQENQGVYASYVFLTEMIKKSMSITRPSILSSCEEAARLALKNPDNEEIVTHVVAFLESLNVDTKNLRNLLLLLKLKPTEVKGFEKFLNHKIKVSASDKDLMEVEALEMFWRIKKYSIPTRGYLRPFLETDDWFRLVLMAQYFNYSLDEFILICERRIENKVLRDNLIRAVSFDIPEARRHCSFSKRRRTKINPQENIELFKGGKFLDSKRDLFAILLKCSENVSRVQLPFDEFQKYFMGASEHVDDLLFHAKKHDWPLIAVLAGTTSLYRIKYCWLTWLILSTDYKLTRRCETIEQLGRNVLEHCLISNFIRTLDESVEIFYPNSTLKTFTTFLRNTQKGEKLDEMAQLLKIFIVKLSETGYQMVVIKGKENLLWFIHRCLIVHLQRNIKFGVQQEKYLECLHRSEINDFLPKKIDFMFLKSLVKILERTTSRLNLEVFCDNSEFEITSEIEYVCNELISNDNFEAAIEIVELMRMPKSEFVYKLWRHMYANEKQKQTSLDIEKYMRYVHTYELDMEIFIKFLSSIVGQMIDCVEKYKIMKFILKNGKEQIDDLEYEVIHLYIRLKCEDTPNLEPLTSKHFDENIGKFLIHHSLYELKALAGIDDLTISYLNLTGDAENFQLEQLILHLLDISDFVQVLRIQEMFGCAPEDLKLIVYMTSVCEGISSIYDISKQERQMISGFGQQLSNRFNRFSLKSFRTSSANSMSSSLMSLDLNESAILDDSSRFKENKETFEALQGLLSKIKHGVRHAQRIVLIYRISLFLNQPFGELLKINDAFEFLELAASCDCENKLMIMSDIIEAMEMTSVEVAEFISKEITSSIIRTRFLEFNKETEMTYSSSSSWSFGKQIMDDIWGFSLSKDLHRIFDLCKGKTTLLGNHLLNFYKIFSQSKIDIPIIPKDESFERICVKLNEKLTPQIMSQKKQHNILVELLINAHECFCQECSTEGITTILTLAKKFVYDLADRKSFNMIVKLLCGIGRYREMFYCFEILIKNDVFEMLLGSIDQASGLKTALLSYLNEYHPNNHEYYKMVASHFLMYSEMAKIWRKSALQKIQKVIDENQVKIERTGRVFLNQPQRVEIPYLRCNKNVISILQEALNDMMHATEMLTVDNKIEMSLKFASFCELIAMQIHLVKIGESKLEEKICPCVVNQEQSAEKFQFFANYELSVPQTMILNKNIESTIDYCKAIFCHAILVGDSAYLLDFIGRLDLTDNMIENIVKLTQLETIEARQEKVLHDLVMMVSHCGLKFKLASLLGLKGMLQQMLNDEQSYHYLLDTKYGNVDIF